MDPDISDLRDKENNGTKATDFYSPKERDLPDAESSPSLYRSSPNSKNAPSPAAKLRALVVRNKKKALIGGGAGGTIIGLMVAAFLLLIPLKIETMVNNLQSRFFATSENATQSETQSLFESYMITRVLPSYKSCGTTVSRHCTVRNFGTNPISSLYRAWSQARLENTLADKYGIEFKYYSKGNSWHLKAPGLTSAGEDIGADGSGLGRLLTSRSEFRSALSIALDDALEKETKFTQVMTRYKIGRLLEEKYGIKRCLIFCGVKDPLADNIADQKIAAKLFLTQRVIYPRNNSLGIVLMCLFNGDNCDATTTKTPGDTDAPATAGTPENQEVDKPVSNGLRDLASKFSVTDEASLKALQNLYNDISEKGFQKWLLTEGLTKIGVSEGTSGMTSDAIPVAGWINMAAQIVNTANNAGPTLKKLRYVTNAAAMVSVYMMYRTYADEIHTGHVTATEVGSMTDSLSAGNNSSSNDPEVGGTASAEETPLYQSLIDNNSSASSTASPNYKCNDGKSVPSGKLICPEESLGGGNSYASTLHSFLNMPGMNVITDLAKVWKNTIGQIFNFTNIILGSIFQTAVKVADDSCNVTHGLAPAGYCQAKDLATKEMPRLVDGVTRWLIPDPFSTNMSGGRTFDMMAGGADVAGNDYAHTGLGGKALTPAQTADIINQQQSQAQQEFSHESVFAQMFSASNQYSLLSKVTMKVPLSWHKASITLFIGFLKNPFASLLNNFASIFSGKTNAAVQAQDDPFGIKQYGYTQSDLDQIGDPEAYWNKNCTDDPTQGYQIGNSWNQSAVNNIDQDTGMPENGTVNPCMLIKATVGSAGGYYDTSLLTQDDLADVNSSTSSTPTTATSDNARQLANKILSNNNIQLAGRDVSTDMQDAANGKPGTANVMTSTAILQLIATVGQNHNITISAIQSGGTGHCNNQPKSVCPNDPHYNGDAVDFSSLDGTGITGRNPPAITIMKLAFNVLPSGSGFGQNECGSQYTTSSELPNNDITFYDTCNHLHVQVPKGTP